MTTPAETDADTLKVAVEAAALAVWDYDGRHVPWMTLDTEERAYFEGHARAALTAAAPLLTKAAEDAAYQRGRTGGWDEGYDRGRQDHCDFMPYPGQPECDVTSTNPYRTEARG